ncbi:MAG: response regulator transcription factor [Sporocytophaga sp.]|uniref:winged helix-turn-helix domain-containing protein n=1 Tax=Sporocytophaga sp. TaxID=2231183 RepID=UPI001B1C1EC3|nr:response regulator transcription factor [Sporocytophaga sp.]MBO9701548.1 response regulator transcription factor [Sporocytophaga sp.]
MKILLVEDEIKVASFIKKGLEEQLHEVTVAYDGYTGKQMALSNPYELFILDINLPQINGIQLCKDLRAANIQAPILLLTALGTTENKVTGLDAGADDYLVKPFEFPELLARLRALSRRTTLQNSPGTKYKIADLEMDTDTKTVIRSGKKIDLTAKEFSLLEYLLKNKGRVISRVDIAEKVWEISFDTGTNVIDVYINFLRKKIDKDFSPKLIHTLVGMGYVLKVED